jgi:hypothetical protein
MTSPDVGAADAFDAPFDDLAWALPPYTRTMLAAAGRLLAGLLREQAAQLGDGALEPDATGHRALALLPDCSGRRDRAFLAQTAAALTALTTDLDGDRPPLPRTAAEAWALQAMAARAPYLTAASDEELAALGVLVPQHTDTKPYRMPAWEYLLERIAEEGALPDADDETMLEHWFEPVDHMPTRDTDEHGTKPSAPPGAWPGTARALRLLALDTPANEPWAAGKGLERTTALAEILTPLGTRLLRAAAALWLEVAADELAAFGDDPYDRAAHGKDPGLSLLAELPRICDHQNAAWRLAVVRAIAALEGDLEAGRAPLPRDTAEEVALSLILSLSEHILEHLPEEGEVVAGHEVPGPGAFTPRHVDFESMRELLYQDSDFEMLYDEELDGIEDPGNAFNAAVGVGDKRPASWFATFGNLAERHGPVPLPPTLLARLGAVGGIFEHVLGQDVTPGPTRGAHRDRAELTAAFEHFVALAQHRFFDLPLAVEMARTLGGLLAAYVAAPELDPAGAWAFSGGRAVVGREYLLVDRDFVLEGLRRRWRLRADLTDAAAREWTRSLLADCAEHLIEVYRSGTAMLHRMRGVPGPTVPADQSARLARSDQALAATSTLAGFLAHRRTELGLSLAETAAAALLPAARLEAWERAAAAEPDELGRLAPVLHVAGHDLAQAAAGVRNRFLWPLPVPPAVPATDV